MKVIYLNDLDGKAYIVQKSADETSISFIQTLVGGLFDCVSLNDDTDIWIHDEGFFMSGYGVNETASFLSGRMLMGPAVIAGNDDGATVEVGGVYLTIMALNYDQKTYTADEVVAIRTKQFGEVVSGVR